LRSVYWFYDQIGLLHELRFSANWGSRLIDMIRKMKSQALAIVIEDDDVSVVISSVSLLTSWEITETGLGEGFRFTI
jgi:hypothetical protein